MGNTQPQTPDTVKQGYPRPDPERTVRPAVLIQVRCLDTGKADVASAPAQTITRRGGLNNGKALAVCRHISSNDRAKTSVTILIIILVLSLVLLDVLTTRKTAVYDRHHEIPLDSLTYQLQTQPGQLYGQPPFQGMPPGSPYYTPTPNGRPSKATAAATLGIVNGSLGILRAIATFLLLAVVFSNPRIRASAGSSYENTGFMLVSTEAICTLGIAVTLLIVTKVLQVVTNKVYLQPQENPRRQGHLLNRKLLIDNPQ